MAWRQAYGGWFELVHAYAHTDKQDRTSLGNHAAGRLAAAGAEQAGTAAPTLRVVEPNAPAGSEMVGGAPTTAWGPPPTPKLCESRAYHPHSGSRTRGRPPGSQRPLGVRVTTNFTTLVMAAVVPAGASRRAHSPYHRL